MLVDHGPAVGYLRSVDLKTGITACRGASVMGHQNVTAMHTRQSAND
jgi:hypothetical protein